MLECRPVCDVDVDTQLGTVFGGNCHGRWGSSVGELGMLHGGWRKDCDGVSGEIPEVGLLFGKVRGDWRWKVCGGGGVHDSLNEVGNGVLHGLVNALIFDKLSQMVHGCVEGHGGCRENRVECHTVPNSEEVGQW